MVAATPYRTDTTPASRNLTYQDIELVSDGIVLEGWWIPAERPVAELIFVHGAGSNRISRYIGSLDFYRTLNELNVSVITMDLRNHGNSPSTDEVLHMGDREWPDVVAAAHWLDLYQPSDLPRFILGASMGGSAAIHALHHGLAANGLILLDPQLDIPESLKQGAEVTTGLPAPLFALAARIAIWVHDLPQGEFSPLSLGESLELPILLLQDWDDPVTRSRFANLLAQRNSHVQLQRVPEIDANAPCLKNKGAWGSHVAAHPCHPRWTRVTIEKFIEKTVNTSPARSSGSPPLS
ncbi:MAG: alpha/beta fold hydrolase [Halieaceae bacterium]